MTMTINIKIKVCVFCNKYFEWKRGMSFTKKTCSPQCHSKYMANKRFKSNNPAWKGKKATVGSIHCWIRDNFIRTNICEHCGKKGNTDWSNKYHTYLRHKKDW